MALSRRLAPVLAVVLLGMLAPDTHARRVRVVCTDGDPACDLDRTCDGVCRLLVGTRRVIPVAVPLRKRDGGPGRRVRRVGRTHFVVGCLPPRTPCKPPLATTCRTDLDAAACTAAGGDYARRGLNPLPACHCRTRDGGTPCRRDQDCEGQCLSAIGNEHFACSAHVVEFGCFLVMDGEGTPRALCID